MVMGNLLNLYQEGKMKDKYYKYICIGFAVILTLATYIYGVPAMADDFATWRNGGLPAEDARCAAAFKLEVE